MTAAIQAISQNSGSGTGAIGNKPTGVVDGDLMIACVAIDLGSSPPETLTPPSGWSTVQDALFDYQYSVRLGVYSRAAGASEPSSWSWTLSASNQWTAVIARIDGHDPTTPVNASAKTEPTLSTTTPEAPSVTTSADDCLILYIAAMDRDGTPFSPPSSTVEQWDYSDGADVSQTGATKTQTTAGSAGAGQFTSSGSNEQWAAVTVAIAPAPSGTDYVRVIDESNQVNDDRLRTLALARINGDVIQLVETNSRFMAMVRTIDEMVQLVESLLHRLAMNRITADDVSVSETSENPRSLARILAETVQAGEAIARLRGFVKIGSDTVSVNESSDRAISLRRIISGALNLVETTLRSRALNRVAASAINVSETSSRATGFIRAVADAVHVAEMTRRTRALLRSINEAEQAGETAGRTLGFVRSISEAVQVSEIIARLRGFIRVVSESVQVSETAVQLMTTVAGFVRSMFKGMFKGMDRGNG